MDEIDDDPSGPWQLYDDLDDAKNQRDELLAALKNVISAWRGEFETIEQARADVAAAEAVAARIEAGR